MSIPVTVTRVVLPGRRPDLLSRQRLLDSLYELLEYRLVLLIAQAGFGKTSLLVDFANQAEIPVCWYSVQPLDRDLLRFLAHFVAAIQVKFPQFGGQSIACLDSTSVSGFNMDLFLTTIVNEAYNTIREHFVLALDDYHLVNDNPAINTFISRFVQNVDENCHLVLASRTLISLPDMVLMVARDQVGGLNHSDLAFQIDEIQALIKQNYNIALPDEKVVELARQSEGWITGLLLSTEALWKGKEQRQKAGQITGFGLYDYLAQQVLEQQPQKVREFLLKTSLLEEFDASLCEDVFGPEQDWKEIIRWVLDNNLFALPVGEDGKSIRYHHLFRDFLQSSFERIRPMEAVSILQRLGSVYQERQEWDKAYEIYFKLGDIPLLAQMIEKSTPGMVKSGRHPTLQEWLATLPGNLVSSNPGLLSVSGVVAVIQGRLDEGLSFLAQAEKMQRDSKDDSGLALTLVRSAFGFNFLGDYQEAIAKASEALKLSQQVPHQWSVQAEANRAVGIGYHQLGHSDLAIEHLNRSLSLFNKLGDRQYQAIVRMELGLAYMNVGSYRKALQHNHQALRYWKVENNVSRQANLFNNLGTLYHQMGEYLQAGSSYEQGLNCARQIGHTRMEAYLLCGVGDLFTDLGIHDGARYAFHQARQAAEKIENRFLKFYTDLGEARLARLDRDYERAHAFLGSAKNVVQSGNSANEWGLWQFEAGLLCLAEDYAARAIDHLHQAQECFEKGKQAIDIIRCEFYLAKARHSLQERKTAIKHLCFALSKAAELEELRTLVVAGCDVNNLLKELLEDPEYSGLASKMLALLIRFEDDLLVIRRNLRSLVPTVPVMSSRLAVYAFKEGKVLVNGLVVRESEWIHNKRVREFLYYLLENPQGLSKENIGLEFWPDVSKAQLNIRFKNLVYRLRVSLGQDIVLNIDDRYYLNSDIDYEYDADRFTRELEEARAEPGLEKKIRKLKSALEIYKGPFLLDLDNRWIEERRYVYERYYREASLELAQAYLEAGKRRLALDMVRKSLDMDPTWELAHRLAMRAYAAMGELAGVTRQYEVCCQVLMEDLHTLPSPETTDLYRSLVS